VVALWRVANAASHDCVEWIELLYGNRCQNRLVRYVNRPNQASMSDRVPYVSRSESHSSRSNGQSYQGPRSARTSGRPRQASSTSFRNSNASRPGLPDETSTWSTSSISQSTAAQTGAPRRRCQSSFHRRQPPVDPGSRARTSASVDETTAELPRRNARQTVPPCGTTGQQDTETPQGHAAPSACPHGKILPAGVPSQPCGRALLSHQLILARPLPSR